MHLGNTVARGPIWAIVLAGGDGTRLRSLTMDGAGNAVPKQFCSFSGGTSLLEQTLDRARSIVEWGRITTIVSVAHRRYWQQPLRILSPENVVVQPVNRGTAVGILLPTLRILEREPAARILILPSDHCVADEFVLEARMRAALEAVGCHPTGVAFLGIEAHDPDPELGCIVPVPVPRCGWTDLGTPQRLARAVARYSRPGAGMPEASWSTPGDRVNLAERSIDGDGTRDYPYQLGGRQ